MNSADSAVSTPTLSKTWQHALLALLLVIPGLLALYWQTTLSMVSIWGRSDTFAHGYVIAPISMWLIWRRRSVLLALTPQVQWSVCWLLLLASCLWAVAELAQVNVVKQFALVLMLPLTVWAALGWRVTRQMLFPLGFLLLMVPFGEVFLLPMMNFTADFTVAALRLTGIPVYRDGLSFMIPSGRWSVVEACSGLRYLIASFTLGLLYAYLTYQSSWKRLVFILASILVPILANGLRAYMIVMLGHLSGMKLAVGVDHLIYGWLFFGVVMLAMYWVGAYWREDEAPLVASAATQIEERPYAWFGVLPILASAALGVVVLAVLLRPYAGAAPQIELAPVAGWQVVDASPYVVPDFGSPAASVQQTWAKAGGTVGVYLALYTGSNKETPLVSAGNRPFTDPSDHIWRLLSHSETLSPVGPVKQMLIHGPDGSWLVQQAYLIDGKLLANDYLAKLWQIRSRLQGHFGEGAAILVYVRVHDSNSKAEQQLAEFWQSQYDGLARSIRVALQPQ